MAVCMDNPASKILRFLSNYNIASISNPFRLKRPLKYIQVMIRHCFDHNATGRTVNPLRNILQMLQ